MHSFMDDVHVQTTVPDDVHERLRRLARRDRRSLKAVLRDAIETYVSEETQEEEDPLWSLVGKGSLPAGDWSERKDWRD